MPRSRLVKPCLTSEEPISQVLRADILAKKQQPNDYLADIESRWQGLEQKLQKYAALLMGAGVLIIYVATLVVSSELTSYYRMFMHMTAVVFLLWFCAKYFSIHFKIYHPAMRYVDVIYQISMTSFFLYMSESQLGSAFALSPYAPLMYVIIIAAASLSINPRLCILSGGLAILGYYLVYGFLVKTDSGSGYQIHQLLAILIIYAVVGGICVFFTYFAKKAVLTAASGIQSQVNTDKQNLELEQAAELQEKLIPPKNPDIEYLDVASFYLPSRAVGGDYYDFVKRENGDWLMAIGDVSGKGFAAAILMSNIQAIVQVLGKQAVTIEEIATELNLAVLKASARGRFITLVLVQFCQGEKKLEYINCGHNPPLVSMPGQGITELTASAPILGIQAEIEYSKKILRFPRNSTLFAYTDGLSELRSVDGVMLEESAITDLLENLEEQVLAQQLKDAVLVKVQSHMGRSRPDDDLSFVCVNARW